MVGGTDTSPRSIKETERDTSEQRQNKRTVFWEVLVCLLILLVLAVLIILWIRPFNDLSPPVMAMRDVRQMVAALEAGQERFKIDYIPSRLKLCKYRCQYDLSNPLDRDSFAWLNQMWPRLVWTRSHSQSYNQIYLRIDWDGTDAGGLAELVLAGNEPPHETPAPVILQGDQCLVFFLGGSHS